MVLDFDGHPQKFDQLQIMADNVAKEVNIFMVDYPSETGVGWKRTHAEIDTQEDLGEEWRQEMAKGAQYVIKETWVKGTDPHLDVPTAKFICFFCVR